MGSPISVVIAELVMQKIENQIFENFPVEIKIWKRYVDDVFAVIPKDKTDILLNKANSVHPNI